jgi:hypothetical protein
MKLRVRRIFVLISCLVASLTTTAQSVNEQVWYEYMLNYPFANSFNLENAFVYSTLLGTPKWRAIDYSAALEWSINQNVDLIGQAVVSYTNQTESYNTLELRPIVGTRLYFTPNQRIQTRLLIRLEQRNFQNLETKEWSQVARPRIRGEVIIPINRKSIYEDKLWYAMTDIEWLYNVEDVEERFANRFRWRIGGGYRLTYTMRFEFLYMLQLSKNQIGEEFDTSDNIFRFRVKQYLRKTKPSSTGGVGN